METNKIFSEIYLSNKWKGENGTFSGPGSSIECSFSYLIFLKKFIEDNKIKDIIDFGCGDFNLMRHFDFSNLNYLGIDVVDFIIEKNNKLYQKSNINFKLKNELNDNDYICDLIIIKDVLQHLSYINIDNILCWLLTGTIKYKFVLITNDFTMNNNDCEDGEHRPINIQLDPFNFKSNIVFEFNSCDFYKKVILYKNEK